MIAHQFKMSQESTQLLYLESDNIYSASASAVSGAYYLSLNSPRSVHNMVLFRKSHVFFIYSCLQLQGFYSLPITHEIMVLLKAVEELMLIWKWQRFYQKAQRPVKLNTSFGESPSWPRCLHTRHVRKLHVPVQALNFFTDYIYFTKSSD